jgi:phosphoglycolate phosphatase-like HAD superfamily hydrolase
MTKKTLIFDFDGTIADSFINFLEIVQSLITKYNLNPISNEDLVKLRDLEANALISKLKIPFYKLPFLALDMKTIQQSQIKTLKVFKGLPDVLTKLKTLGYSLNILTSNSKQNVELFIKQNDLLIFDQIYGDVSLFGKDKAVLKFIKQNSLSQETVIYVGDEIRDIAACKKAGTKIIAVSWGFNSKAGLLKSDPDYLIDKPSELLNILK